LGLPSPENLEFNPKIARKGVEQIRQIETLTTINNRHADKFWKLYDSGAFR
jgi:hypothetical protein